MGMSRKTDRWSFIRFVERKMVKKQKRIKEVGRMRTKRTAQVYPRAFDYIPRLNHIRDASW